LGRWINRDPIGEAGGVNVYAYVDNDSVGSVDPFGLWKDLDRSSANAYWTVVAESDRESISDLTRLLSTTRMYLHQREALGTDGWLRDLSGGVVTEVKNCKKYRGPNTVHLTYGDMTPTGGFWPWSFRRELHSDVLEMGRTLRSIDFHVVDWYGLIAGNKGMQYSAIKAILKDRDDIAAWAHTGHGEGPNPFLGGSPSTGRLIIRNGPSRWKYPASSFAPRWKLSYIMQWACYAGLQPWSTHTAPGGLVFASSRAIMPFRENPFYMGFGQAPIWTRL